MRNEKSYFGFGLIVGIIISALFLFYFAPRYNTVQSGENIIRQDKWTGHSWRYADNQWKKISDVSQDWQAVDQALHDALNIPFAKVNVDNALSTLKENFPVLKDVSNDELLERIKLVYSKQVVCNLYLKQYMDEKGMGGEEKH